MYERGRSDVCARSAGIAAPARSDVIELFLSGTGQPRDTVGGLGPEQRRAPIPYGWALGARQSQAPARERLSGSARGTS